MTAAIEAGLAPYAAMSLLIVVAACLQGIGGVGFAMVSAPIAWLWFPDLTPGPLLAMAGTTAVLVLRREWRHVDWSAVLPASVGRLGGTVAAGALFQWLPAHVLGIVFGLLLLAAVALSLLGRTLRESAPNLIVAGLASGVMGTITSAGASPLVLILQRAEPARLRATMSAILIAGTVMSLALLAHVGRFSVDQALLSAALLPALLLGFWISSRLIDRLPARTVRHALLALTTLGALGALAQGLHAL